MRRLCRHMWRRHAYRRSIPNCTSFGRVLDDLFTTFAPANNSIFGLKLKMGSSQTSPDCMRHYMWTGSTTKYMYGLKSENNNESITFFSYKKSMDVERMERNAGCRFIFDQNRSLTPVQIHHVHGFSRLNNIPINVKRNDLPNDTYLYKPQISAVRVHSLWCVWLLCSLAICRGACRCSMTGMAVFRSFDCN